eukprot:scaffold89969_cov19-Tisochrysis_lutea.AAC.1
MAPLKELLISCCYDERVSCELLYWQYCLGSELPTPVEQCGAGHQCVLVTTSMRASKNCKRGPWQLEAISIVAKSAVHVQASALLLPKLPE